ncbi:MAG: hypothetical protein GX557_12265 [Chloroflexi bacterium]|nr:hypothetical protein [Chloroflexota bacterium]
MFDLAKLDVNRIIGRLLRMVKFDNTVYKEIEEDENANTDALVIVLVAGLLAAIGGAIGAGSGFVGFILQFVGNVLVRWLLWSAVTWYVGTKLFGGQATFIEMARVLGYATAPMALGLLSLIPCVGIIVAIATFALSVYIGFLAVREALDLPTDKTIFTILISAVAVIVIYVLLAIIGLPLM